jgi:hypothetical protein
VFTPNLDFLKETVYDDNFFLEMVKIALYLSLKLEKLKFIPSHNYCLKACSLNLVNFKKIKQEMSMTIFLEDEVIDCLHEFKCLTFLKLNIITFNEVHKLDLV